MSWVSVNQLSRQARCAINAYHYMLDDDERRGLQVEQVYHERSVPTTQIIDHVMNNDYDVAEDTWDEYHEWYMGGGDVPTHEERWPVIVVNGRIDDGWHRLHSYIEQGDEVIPVLDVATACAASDRRDLPGGVTDD